MLKEKYNPKDFEEELYQRWEEKGYFKPSMDKTKENYCIMMPPPNVTGKLHMGHALDDTIQDILIRFKRMQGYNTLWLPGSDHSSISTEMKVVQKLKEEGDTIHFITARLMNIAECDTEEITKDSLRNFNIPYDSLNLHISDKLTFCKENGIELLIEDSYETCIELTDNGIKSILMTTKMNADINDDGRTRVNNWDEVYQKIQEMKETCKEQEDVR